MKKPKLISGLFTIILFLGVPGRLFAEDAEVKLNSSDGSTKMIVQDKDAKIVSSFDSAGNLVVSGTATVAGSKFSVGGSTLVVAGGNVGIGTTGPGYKLDIQNGDVNASGNLREAGAALSGKYAYVGGANASGNWSITAASATNLTGGINNQIPYQSAANTTGFVSSPGANVVLYGNSGAPAWTNTPTITGTNITGVPWAGVLKTGSSLADLATKSAGDLNSGTLALARGGSGADLSATGGATSFVRQASAGAAFTVGTISDADVPDSITLTNITQVTNRAITNLTGTLTVGNGGTGATSLTGFVRGSGTSAFTAAAIADADVPDTITINGTNNVTWASVSKTGSNLTDIATRSHSSLSSLSSDDHTQYALLAGRGTGQTLSGGTAASNNLTLDSTSNGTKGYVLLNPSGGNVGIGTMNPQAMLDVSNINLNGYGTLLTSGAGGSWPNQLILSNGWNGSIGDWLKISLPGASANTSRVILVQSGNFGIGTDTPGEKLDIAGGNGRVESGKSWLTNSDARYKTNITTLENALGKVLGLRGVRYDLKEDTDTVTGNGKYIGFIAQELEKEYPELVHTDAKGYKSVSYDKMTSILVEAVKALKSENDELKRKIAEIEQKLNK